MDGSNQKETDSRQELAYDLVFQDMYHYDVCRNQDIKYIAVNLTGVLLENRQALLKLLHDFCEHNGYELLQETFDTLKSKGYLLERLSRFEKGILITFKDIELCKDKLRTSCEKWRDGRGARGSDYTVEMIDGSWKITDIGNSWVS